MPFIPHVGLDPFRRSFVFMAVQTLMELKDPVMQPSNEALKVGQVILFRYEHAMVFGHMHHTELQIWRVVVAEQATVHGNG